MYLDIGCFKIMIIKKTRYLFLLYISEYREEHAM